MPTNKQTLLKQEIKALPFSDELKGVLISHFIVTLNDLVELEVYNWHKKLKGFNFHHQHEVVSYLMKNDLREFIKDD